jgi:hypothetical protein
MLNNYGRIGSWVSVGSLFLLLSGCAIHSVATALNPGLASGELCIHENPRVIIGDFLPAVESAARRHGFDVRVFRNVPASCRVVIEYDGHQKWDFTNFMNKAEIKVFDRGVLVAEASYSTSNGVFGGGGLNGEKWRSTKYKLDPLLDRIFSNYPLRAEE